ncbi:MAG: T9SS type A sorting domain-containing protein [Bacteroidetes bacterium]|nr:T9SS type A sorting domain-containing protein [Bacteroidota bacterium]
MKTTKQKMAIGQGSFYSPEKNRNQTRTKRLGWSLFLMMLLSYSAGVKAQCGSGGTSYTCGSTFNLNINVAPTAGYTYDWYECNSGGGSASYIGSGVTYTASAVSSANETKYYLYIASLGASIICTSPVYTVYYDQQLEISASSSVPGAVLTAQPYTGYPGYTTYQWYKNGAALSGATSSTFTTQTGGNYYLVSSSTNCGTRTSNTINIPVVTSPCATANFIACGGSVNVTSPNGTGYYFNWYKCNSSGGSAVLQSGTSSTHNFALPAPGNQTEYYYYESYDQLTNVLECTSGIGTIVYDEAPVISASLPSPPSALSYAPYASGVTYSSFQWYHDGVAITGATSSGYTALDVGDYYLIATSDNCSAPLTSNTITLDCSIPDVNNIPISSTITYSNRTIILVGTITIPQKVTVNFNNCKIVMQECSEIIVDKATANVNGGRLNITDSRVFSCSKWNGIYVIGYSNTAPDDYRAGGLNLDGTSIEDAFVGVSGINHAYIDMFNCSFSNNYRHINLEAYNYWNGNPALYYATNVTIDSVFFDVLMSSSPSSSPFNCAPTHSIGGLGSPDRSMVHAKDVRNILFKRCHFNCDKNGVNIGSTLAMDLEEIVIGFNSRPWGVEIHKCHFYGDYDDLVRIHDNSQAVYFYGNPASGVYSSFLGTFDRAIVIEDAINTWTNPVTIEGCLFVHSSNSYGTAIHNTESSMISIGFNTIVNFKYGIEMYCKTNSHGGANISHNTINLNQYGIVIAPSENPVTSGAVNSNSAYYNNNNWNSFLMHCNHIFRNGWGIVGVGDLPPQKVTATVGGVPTDYDWETFFDSSLNSTTNTYGDIAWYTPFVMGVPNPVFFISASVNTDPLFLGASSIALDNHTINSGNFTDYLDYNTHRGASGLGCRGSFKKEPENTGFFNSAENNHIDISPNPFSVSFEMSNLNYKALNLQVYDMNGKLIIQQNVLNRDEYRLVMDGYASGIYLIKIINLIDGSIVKSQKLLKIN